MSHAIHEVLRPAQSSCGTLHPGDQSDILSGIVKGNTMNKLVKGSIAGAAGIALLLGGAGTLAYWNSSADLAAATINSGTLTISAGDLHAFFPNGDELDANSRIVPGDRITIEQDVTIDATGDNLFAKLTVGSGWLSSVQGLNLSYSAKTGTGGTISDLSRLTAEQARSIEQVVIVGTFPTSVSGTEAQNLPINLSMFTLDLTQVL
jgi:alternate signal-mediated exported protein